MAQPEIDLTPFRFRTIIADPPWGFENWSEKGEAKNPSAHYDCLPLDQIKALNVSHIAAPDCLLMLWATAPLLPEAIETMRAWGFTYKTFAPWAKQSKTGRKWAFGPGYILRSAAEIVLIGTLGRPPIRSRATRNLIVAPVREHSRKPDDQYTMAEAIGAPPYAELFSRSSREGWEAWGKEIGKFDGKTPRN